MKTILFMAFMAMTIASCTYANEQINTQEDSTFFSGLEFKRRHHHHSSSKSGNQQNPVLLIEENNSLAYGSFYTQEGQALLDIIPTKKSSTLIEETDKEEKKIKELLPFQSPITPSGSTIILNQTSVATDSVTLQAGGNIVINQIGDYLVKFGASITFSELGAGQIGLVLDGVSIPSSNISLVNGGFTSASTVISIQSVPATLTLVNSGEIDFALFSSTLGDITAFMSINKLDVVNQ